MIISSFSCDIVVGVGIFVNGLLFVRLFIEVGGSRVADATEVTHATSTTLLTEGRIDAILCNSLTGFPVAMQKNKTEKARLFAHFSHCNVCAAVYLTLITYLCD